MLQHSLEPALREARSAQVFDAESFFRDNLGTTRRVVTSVCRRYAGPGDDAEDFCNEALLKIMEGDYAVLHKFRSDSSYETYLRRVVHNQLLDWRTARWGKWRPSARALRLGPVAVQIDSLTTRDGLSQAEAIETLATRSNVQDSREQLEEIANQLPHRSPRPRLESREIDESLPLPVDESPTPESRVVDSELSTIHDKVERSVRAALASLDSDDRIIIQMRHLEGVSVADIARRLKLDQRRLYRRIKNIEAALRVALVTDGVTANDTKRLFGWEKLDLNLELESSTTDS